MNNIRKTVVAGVVLGSVFITGAFAGGTVISATLRPDIKVVIDGAQQSFKDVNGNAVYPASYNDTTYLPIRAIGGIMGKSVGWDEETQTITLFNPTEAENGKSEVDGFAAFKKQIDQSGLEYTSTNMAADLIGAERGEKYKFSFGKVELYRFADDSEAFAKVKQNKEITLDGVGAFPVEVHGNMVMLIDVTEHKDELLKVFEAL